ncbi:MAG: hypothetical protein KME63_15935 [Candidatus Thiodiazotropha sp. (ex Clathrolucina costata)]|nr:hypothetical protein [Candidatus Thiodiazotropha taylori]MCG7863605.1 hypothetical protein [Candidatus Thiodiazotropha endolucinida]
MKEYIVYFANNENYSSENKFEFEYSVEASNEEEARQIAIKQFNTDNPSLNLDDYTTGFIEN